jgi:uncharacterized protein
MKFTPEQRLILMNQCDILAVLKPDQRDDWETHKEMLREGYEVFYHDMGRVNEDDGITVEECHEVHRIIQMYQSLQGPSRASGGGLPKIPFDLQFPGFDGNTEVNQLAFAVFTCERKGRGRYLMLQHGDLNSHFPMLATYRAQFAVWARLSNRNALSDADIAAVMAAKP